MQWQDAAAVSAASGGLQHGVRGQAQLSTGRWAHNRRSTYSSAPHTGGAATCCLTLSVCAALLPFELA